MFKKAKKVLVYLISFGFVFETFLFYSPSKVQAATITVCAAGCDYTTIQEAVNNASNGDIITVSAGTYTETIIINGLNNLTLRGAGASSTTINGDGAELSIVNITNSSNFRLENFSLTNALFGIEVDSSSGTITNNIIEGLVSTELSDAGGIIAVASDLNITNNIIRNNTAGNPNTESFGILAMNTSGTVKISNNTLTNNGLGILGFGVTNMDLLIDHNSIIDNRYVGILAWGNIEDTALTGSIYANTISQNGGPWIELSNFGSGIFLAESQLNVYSNLITANNGLFGAGIITIASTANRFFNNIIASNTVTGVGGGLISLGDSSPIYNNTIVYNSAAGQGQITNPNSLKNIKLTTREPIPEFINQKLELTRQKINQFTQRLSILTLEENEYGGGILISNGEANSPSIYNNIIWGNTTDDFADQDGDNSVIYSDLGESIAGVGNISADPLLSNYNLTQNSPAIDAGTSNNAPPTDFDGTIRPQHNGIDMGAYEYAGPLPELPETGITINSPTENNLIYLFLSMLGLMIFPYQKLFWSSKNL